MISVVIITYNEGKNIGKCLESVKWADEIILVDSGSTDDTITIAKKYNVKIFHNFWKGYGAQKNFAIDKSNSDWILSIDADETVEPALYEEIKNIIQNPGDYMAFKIPRKLIFQDKYLRWGGCYPNYQIRLFLKSKAKFNLALVHEKLVVNGKIGFLKNSLIHYSYKNLSDYFERFNRYTTLDSKKRFSENRKFHFWYYIQPVFRFFNMYFLRLGFLDGIQGLDWAIFSSFYTFVKFQKLKELQNEKK
ncbi:MAG: glycosyltransferase family 2 protein [Elusimicrobia bacterium]|nr:glycosyltransferase family 2 protein [Elusimicrobiota bacterium]